MTLERLESALEFIDKCFDKGFDYSEVGEWAQDKIAEIIDSAITSQKENIRFRTFLEEIGYDQRSLTRRS